MNIDFRNVSFSYPNREAGALKDINLKISQGEFVLLAGSSGCGKTTVTRILNGLIPGFYGGKIEGNVFLDGCEIRDYKSYELAFLVGSVFQNPRTQFFNVDTDSEITFGLENAGMPTKKINEVFDKVTKELELGNLRAKDIFKLSGGEKQKIAFASVYASAPELYLIDEPSANLDTLGIEALKKCLEKIKSQGKTVVIAEHRLYYLAQLVDRVIYLKDGRIEKEIDGDTFRSMSVEALNQMGLRTNQYFKATKKDVKKCREITDDKTLSLKKLSIGYGKKRVLNNLNHDFYKGKICCVTGRNGVGKSTLLRTVCGFIKRSDGNIILNGKEISPKELKKKAFMVMQDVNYQLFADSVLNECILGTKGDSKDKAGKVLKELNLLEFKDYHPNTLSGGQKQRLAIAVSLMMNKEIILFDEPTSGLDYKNMRLCADFLKKLANKGKIIIVVTHDEEFIDCCCDEIYNLA
ncbi:energy-coupling factor transport system ATP-binding protein [Acetitomaculum ruminis DSM 5522]|uniref:Energy-coupling factor transport system ATP-binding protein n=1 Tax=Acetitomaculum ruminis DSM 5522 TaxID=1120918 RepID=A0A1I1A441_9FIRM|nr:energy-coupling factor ABC transporter ATP-binding protein [Acetitomaculum ruminis]SFB32116.1 energy-coupling factor transport system ATP-binding protein [Acetitomaculum ruminis DSM 5522]